MNENVRIVSQYGVLGEISSDRHFSVISPYWNESFSSHSLFLKKYGLSPVCHLYKHPSLKGKELIILLETEGSGAISPTLNKEEELRKILFELVHKSLSAFQVLFHFGAMDYHLCSLAKAYTQLATASSDILKIPGSKLALEDKESFVQKKLSPRWISAVPVSKVGAFTIGTDSAEAVYYEMMAYLTSARSLLDSLMPILNLAFGRKIALPNRYTVFMKKLSKYDVPTCLKDFLSKNWVWVSKMTDYRDCVIHAMFPSTSPLPLSMMAIHSEHNIIALQTWLPDNPEDKPKHSNKKYRFDEHIEYLSYAHTTYLRMLNFVTHVLESTLHEIKPS
jgi:hypothetical protein